MLVSRCEVHKIWNDQSHAALISLPPEEATVFALLQNGQAAPSFSHHGLLDFNIESATSPKEAVVYAVLEARRAALAILHLPHLQL